MAVYRFQQIFDMDTAIPADAITNTTHWRHTTGQPQDFDNIRDMLRDFWTVQPTGGSARMDSYLAQEIQPTVRVKAWHLDDPLPRVPVYESTFTVTPSTGSDALPHEVALCLSFQAERESGTSQARRRNRIFLGPFSESASAGNGAPATALVSNCIRAARSMLAAADNSASWNWCGWSQTDQDYFDLTNGWVDNAWDTQRRRGLSPTTRSVWTASTP